MKSALPMMAFICSNSGCRSGAKCRLKRFHDRRHDPLKIWKLSPVDLEALSRWADYSRARDVMLERSDSAHAPWTIARFNDKRRGRLNVIRTVLDKLTYENKDPNAIGDIDRKIIMSASEFLALKEVDAA
ncbi:hypothetical protein PSQ19_16895 [Devosia algicola]|uniref:Polyphosphate kinase-2-related domain-containing protein n=1 Tax=Devosia algicola TaxID=3026418 RepID=A0ABY7YLV0_9HYPH|nr:hypothetical protein [Devosia algicola]WDR02288.1 hypothetical protein PSQ19_16895 [Devosia algicola]